VGPTWGVDAAVAMLRFSDGVRGVDGDVGDRLEMECDRGLALSWEESGEREGEGMSYDGAGVWVVFDGGQL